MDSENRSGAQANVGLGGLGQPNTVAPYRLLRFCEFAQSNVGIRSRRAGMGTERNPLAVECALGGRLPQRRRKGPQHSKKRFAKFSNSPVPGSFRALAGRRLLMPTSLLGCVQRVLGSRQLAVVELEAPVRGHVVIPMGKRSTRERPPRVRPCKKGSSAACDPRSADAERRANPGVTGEREPHFVHLSALPDKSKREVADAAHEGERR